jgi:hypothetical protein
VRRCASTTFLSPLHNIRKQPASAAKTGRLVIDLMKFS